MSLSFHSKVDIRFAPGEIKSTGGIIKAAGWQRVLIFTDRRLKELGFSRRLKEIISKNNLTVEVFSGVKPNPKKEIIKQGVEKARDFEPDVIAALGGGSVLDAAKAAGIWYSNPEKDLFQLKDPGKRKNPMLPVITIPTTAGTGSEITSWAVITDPGTPAKVSIGGEKMTPAAAVIDPELTRSLPAELTIWTGLDAFSHALEAYLSKFANAFIQDICYLAMKRLIKYLPRAADKGENLAARSEVMLGSLLAGWAMENAGLGLIHGMSHQVSAFYNYQHGLTNSLLLSPVLEYNCEYCKEELQNLTDLFPGNKDFLESMERFCNLLGFKKELEIKSTDLPRLTVQTLENVNSQTNPRKPSAREVEELFCRAFKIKE